MNVHKNARLTPRGRERIVRQVESGQAPEAVAKVAGVCPRTVRKWVDRNRREGLRGLQDRSSRPHRLRRPTPQAVIEEISYGFRPQRSAHHASRKAVAFHAPRRGNDIGARSYGSIDSILQHGLDRAYAQDKAPDGAPIRHANIRGQGYYH